MQKRIRVGKEILDLREKGLEFMAWESSHTFGSTRIGAGNRITDNVQAIEGGYFVWSALDKKIGMTTEYYGVDLSNAIKMGAILAVDAPRTEWFTGFPRVIPAELHKQGKPLNAHERTKIIKKMRAAFAPEDLYLSGALASCAYSGAIYSSTGDRFATRAARFSGAQTALTMAVTDEHNTMEVLLQSVGTGSRNLHVNSLITEGLEEMRLQRSLPFEDIAPGQYPAVIAAPAISSVVQFACYLGWYGRNMVDGTAIFSPSDIGRQVFGSNITIIDDPADPENPGAVPYGYWSSELQRRTAYVKDGVLMQPWYTVLDAQRDKGKVTGIPRNLQLHAGDGPGTMKQAAQDLGEGLLIKMFHYTRPEDSSQGTFTGMTRYGTYRVHGGEIVARLPNLRFLESAPRMLNDVRWLSQDRVAILDEEQYGIEAYGTFLLPKYARLGHLNITGSTPMDQQR